MKNIKSTKGFTLIEALIVVIIVGLLAGVGIVKLGSAKDDAVVSVTKAAAAEVNKGLQRAIVANDGAGYATPVLAANITPAGVIAALVTAGHFTQASADAMTASLAKGDGLTLSTAGVAIAADTTLKALAEGGYEVKPTP